MGIVSQEPRFFELDNEVQKVTVSSSQRGKSRKGDLNYTKYINSNLYEVEKRQLEKSLSFKQYRTGQSSGIEDLRRLIRDKDKNGVFLWDPFLTPNDILNTLFFSPSGGVPLKAIGSINKTVKDVYTNKGINVEKIIEEYKKSLDNPNHNNNFLNLEFRVQHTNYGWGFHDRFLIFPGSLSDRPIVYSLGTSVNSFGKSHHILQEVSHPQPVIDAFNELWEKLNNPNCIVWKYPS